MQAAFALPMHEEHLPGVMQLLDSAGTRSFAETHVANQHTLAVHALEAALGADAKSSRLYALAEGLLNRAN